MINKVYLTWKVLLTLDEQSPNYSLTNKLFKQLTGNNFIRDIGGITDYSLAPTVLEPTVAFHNALNSKKNHLGFSGNKFPYKDSENRDINVNIHLHYGKYVIVTVVIKQPFFSSEYDIAELQDIKQHKQLFSLIKNISGIITTNDFRNYIERSSFKVYPCTFVCHPSDENIPDNLAVEIITRHKNVTQNIVDSVIQKNTTHQINTANILADKQGIFYRVPECFSKNTEINKKFTSVCNLMQLCATTEKALENKKFKPSKLISKFLSKMILAPELYVRHSVTARKTLELMCDEFQLKKLLETKNDNFISHAKNLIKSKEFIIAVISIFIALSTYIYNISPYKNKVESFLNTSKKDVESE